MKAISFFAASARASSLLSNTQKPFTRYPKRNAVIGGERYGNLSIVFRSVALCVGSAPAEVIAQVSFWNLQFVCSSHIEAGIESLVVVQGLQQLQSLDAVFVNVPLAVFADD